MRLYENNCGIGKKQSMEGKYKHQYRIPPARLTGWDYGSSALYFVTICTKDREPYFGEIVTSVVETHNYASLRETEIGTIAREYWLNIPQHFPFIELDQFMIMPNHIHGILCINKPDYEQWNPSRFEPQKNNLPSTIRGYKASVKRYAVMHQIEFAWQPRYFDRIVRNEKELHSIREYIINNPAQWHEDRNKIENLLM